MKDTILLDFMQGFALPAELNPPDLRRAIPAVRPPDVLKLTTRPDPLPGPGEVLIFDFAGLRAIFIREI